VAELFTLRPLFPGISEADEIYKICSVLGTPTKDSWADGLHLARDINYQFPEFAGVHLSVLIPSASSDAISLITSLCSWDPSKRPTAVEALQHPFFQSCFYVPPSLRSRATVVRTPPSAGTRRAMEQQSGRRHSVAFSSSEFTRNYPSPKLHAPLSTGVQRKLDLVNQDASKNDQSLKSSVKQARYRPPGKNSPTSMNRGRATRGVMDSTEKLANMTLGPPRKQFVGQPCPPPMKAGVKWNSGSGDMLLRPTKDIQQGRTYARKVVG